MAVNTECSSGLNSKAGTVKHLHERPRQGDGVHTQPTYRWCHAGKGQEMCQKGETGLPFRRTLTRWRNGEMGMQSSPTQMNKCKILPKGWKSFHSTCGYIRNWKGSRLRELIIPFPTGACEVAHEVLWLVLRDWQTGTGPKKDYRDGWGAEA